MSGVVAYVNYKDIPGINSVDGNKEIDVVFVESDVGYAGQAVGLIVAESQEIALEAAKMVQITYKNQEKPILTIKEALAQPPQKLKKSVFSSTKKKDNGKRTTKLLIVDY